MKDKITVSTLSISDWPAYKTLRLKALQDDPMAFTNSFQESIDKVNDYWIGHLKAEDSESVTLFAKKGNKLAGMVSAIFNDRQKTKHIAEIVGAYVDPEFRGHGIGSLLMEAIMNKIKQNPNVEKIKLDVITTQKPAVALYKKFGFKVVGEFEKDLKIDDKYYNNYAMEKFI